jgi:hypothetical protein
MTNPYLDLTAQFNRGRRRRDLMRLAAEHPDSVAEAMATRPLLARIADGRDALDEALDRERRAQMRADEARLARYRAAAEAWASVWPDVSRQIAQLPLHEAHRIVTSRAEGLLPFAPPDGGAGARHPVHHPTSVPLHVTRPAGTAACA